MKAPFIRSNYNYDTNEAGDESGLKCEDKTLTQQHMKDECDINVLMDRFVVKGAIPQLAMPPMQGDFENVPTYQEALNLMVQANRSFMGMDAKIRAKFENDPGQFVQFASDPNNLEELRKWGFTSTESDKAAQAAQTTEKARIDALERDAALYRAAKNGV